MPEWFGNVAWPAWGWWLVPLVCMVFCMMMCVFFRKRMHGRRFCCWSGVDSADVAEMKKEIKALKEMIENNKQKRG